MQRCREDRQQRSEHRFRPEVQRQGEEIVLPVVFPDGTTAELTYPEELGLHRLDIQPAVELFIRGSKATHGRFLRMGLAPPHEAFLGEPPVETYEGPLGSVEVRQASDPEEQLYELLMHFELGAWNIIVGDGNEGDFMGPDNRRVWAESLSGYESSGGWPVLEPRAPLSFARGPGRPDIYFSSCGRFIELRLGDCKDLAGRPLAKRQYAQMVRGITVHRSDTRKQSYASWCVQEEGVSIYLDERDSALIDLAVANLRVQNVKPPP
jgi:hypothetical protein